VIHGTVLDEEILARANAATAQTFLGLTSNEEVNLLAAQLARETFNVPRVRVLFVDSDQTLISLIDRTAIQNLPETWHNIEEWDHWLSHNKTEEVKIRIAEPVETSDFAIESETGQGSLPLLVVRNGIYTPFVILNDLERGDELIALTHKP
jgi:hypothetical protein